MKTQFFHNFQPSTLFEAVKEISGDDGIASAVFSLVYAKNNTGQWAFFIGSCTIGRTDNDVRGIYEDFAFVRKTYTNPSVCDLLCAIDKIGEGLGTTYQRLDAPATLSCTESIIPSFCSKGTFPFRRFAASLSSGSYNLGVPLVGYGLPYQPSARLYVKEFLGLNRYHGESDGDNGSFSVYVEDRRGRIVLQADKVQIESDHSELLLVGQLSGMETISLNVGETYSSSRIDAESSDLWLIDSDNRLIDFVAASHCYYSTLDADSDRSTSEMYIRLIENGESHTCEFKSYIDLHAKSSAKAEQIERTVCAFSNAAGGKLLIGVSDDGLIEGVEGHITRGYETTIENGLALYTKAIRKRLNEKLRHGQCAKVKAVEVGGKCIVEVDTVRSEDVNYYLESRLGFVRRGATSTKMTAADHRETSEQHFI